MMFERFHVPLKLRYMTFRRLTLRCCKLSVSDWPCLLSIPTVCFILSAGDMLKSARLALSPRYRWHWAGSEVSASRRSYLLIFMLLVHDVDVEINFVNRTRCTIRQTHFHFIRVVTDVT